MIKYPGSVINNAWVFPIINYINHNGKPYNWRIEIKLRNMISGEVVPIDMEYFNNQHIPDVEAEYFSTYGMVGGKEQSSGVKHIKVGKNLNKINATNVFTQALSESHSTHKSFAKKHTDAEVVAVAASSVTADEEILDFATKASINILENVDIKRLSPMLLNSYGRVLSDNSILHDGVKLKFGPEYDIWIQRKINDIRLVSYITADRKLDIYTRGLITLVGFQTIYDEINFILSTFSTTNIYLDGGLYKHDMPLQELSGIVRRQEHNIEAEEGIIYYLFDVFDNDATLAKLTYIERKTKLEQAYAKAEKLYGKHFKCVKLLESTKVTSDEDILKVFNMYISEGYEGAILRRSDGPYKISRGESRSNYVLKLKQRHDAEYEIVGYKEGTARHAGAIIWQLKTLDDIVFDVVPLGDIESRRQLYTELATNVEMFDEYYGKFMTIQYEELSNRGVPLRAQATGIRTVL